MPLSKESSGEVIGPLNDTAGARKQFLEARKKFDVASANWYDASTVYKKVAADFLHIVGRGNGSR